HWMWWPLLGGLVVGLGGLLYPRALGVGYDTIHDLLTGRLVGAVLLGLLLTKAVIWAVALGSGTSGGVLAPLLIMGGSLGALDPHREGGSAGDARDAGVHSEPPPPAARRRRDGTRRADGAGEPTGGYPVPLPRGPRSDRRPPPGVAHHGRRGAAHRPHYPKRSGSRAGAAGRRRSSGHRCGA